MFLYCYPLLCNNLIINVYAHFALVQIIFAFFQCILYEYIMMPFSFFNAIKQCSSRLKKANLGYKSYRNIQGIVSRLVDDS